MNKRILLSFLFLAATNTGANGMQRFRNAYTTTTAISGHAVEWVDQRFDQAIGAGRTADDIRDEHRRLCINIAAIIATLETTRELDEDFDVDGQLQIIMERAHDLVEGGGSQEDIQMAITEILTNSNTQDLLSLEESLKNFQKRHLEELQQLGSDIKLGKLTYREAVKKASPYVKTALKYLIYTSIFVGICNIFLPEALSSPISSSYWYLLGLPISLAWWTIKLPFKPLVWLWQSYILQNQLEHLQEIFNKTIDLERIKPCIEICLKTFADYLKSNAGELKKIQEYCTANCKQ